MILHDENNPYHSYGLMLFNVDTLQLRYVLQLWYKFNLSRNRQTSTVRSAGGGYLCALEKVMSKINLKIHHDWTIFLLFFSVFINGGFRYETQALIFWWWGCRVAKSYGEQGREIKVRKGVSKLHSLPFSSAQKKWERSFVDNKLKFHHCCGTFYNVFFWQTIKTVE